MRRSRGLGLDPPSGNIIFLKIYIVKITEKYILDLPLLGANKNFPQTPTRISFPLGEGDIRASYSFQKFEHSFTFLQDYL